MSTQSAVITDVRRAILVSILVNPLLYVARFAEKERRLQRSDLGALGQATD
jgi:hypothetical protein